MADTCPVEGCDTETKQIVCSPHWGMIPMELRHDIHAAARRVENWHDAYEKYDAQPDEKKDPETITALAQKVNDAYDAWAELRDTAVGEIEIQEAEAAA